MKNFIYYLEMILSAMAMIFLFCAMVGVMLCIIRDDMRFGWLTTTFAISSLSAILMKIYLFND